MGLRLNQLGFEGGAVGLMSKGCIVGACLGEGVEGAVHMMFASQVAEIDEVVCEVLEFWGVGDGAGVMRGAR